ncbi:MBL fold metallo-hydrolase [Parafrankia sp. BMG5.11]|uniref:MBL fold metallo-hydrolase n=1 Tax=Parafrankia sp. BMG5.11 TaxID=222540 RepID=UPI0014043DC1|nr:MBL fold metallo-hydrolase [Parafrankia sp. BMG5.11]CAI7980794.1 Beta-lactamase domain protein [Frankia sp. Hr75.2]
MTAVARRPGVGLPPVEQLRPGLWSIPVPLPTSGLSHVFVYLFETDHGAYVIDSGWDTDAAFAAVEAGLATAGYAVTDLRGIMPTHMHPDHYGLAGRLREASGAWIALHPADAALLRDHPTDPMELFQAVNEGMVRAGAPADALRDFTVDMLPPGPLPALPQPDILLEDGDRPDVPGWDLRAVWTPGHSPGHLCFWEPANRLLLSGDHVLPRITPNIPFEARVADDPLGDYLRSLDKVDALPAEGTLPAHEYRFEGLSSRLAELRLHHEHRFAEVIAALRPGATTAWEVARLMTWSRPWDEIGGFMKRSAVSEALAHLRALERRGLVHERPGDPPTWRFTGS